jgi:hypothetical protein
LEVADVAVVVVVVVDVAVALLRLISVLSVFGFCVLVFGVCVRACVRACVGVGDDGANRCKARGI